MSKTGGGRRRFTIDYVPADARPWKLRDSADLFTASSSSLDSLRGAVHRRYDELGEEFDAALVRMRENQIERAALWDIEWPEPKT